MPDECPPNPDPRTEPDSVLGGISPDQIFARALNTVKMTASAVQGWTPPGAEEVSRLLPAYEVQQLIGRGGMGAVYRARQLALDRVVAIKLLPLEISVEPEFAERFAREARTMARLNHPNIIAVYDFGTTSEGHLFFAMEYVEGANLADVIHQAGLTPEQALSITTQVCTALAYAHAKGVVHRDIKPANVMIDLDSHAKVADFGLARLMEPDPASFGTTMTGTVMGTPDYMAPEQMKGMKVDHRADIYSLGVMIYEMLCREVPRGAFDPPSHRTGCDPRLDTIVLRAMHQSPERRYQSTAEMKADVETARSPLPVGPAASVPRVVTSPVPRPVARKARRLLYAGLAVVVALVAAAIVWAKQSKHPGETRSGPSETFAGVNVGDQGRAGARPSDVSPAAATKNAPFENGLGMKFVPVPIPSGPSGGQRVLLSVWETRVQDYEAFTNFTLHPWPKPPFPQDATHPALNVSWEDAQAFCAWLTETERKAGRIGPGERYRLPTDYEWSCAAGLGQIEKPEGTPQSKGGKVPNIYPWGSAWPPPSGAGNYRGEEVGPSGSYLDTTFRDSFPNTAPVGSFAANDFGLFDLGGNALEWTDSLYENFPKVRAMRGGGFKTGIGPAFLSSFRFGRPVAEGVVDSGFRCVLASELVGTIPPVTSTADARWLDWFAGRQPQNFEKQGDHWRSKWGVHFPLEIPPARDVVVRVSMQARERFDLPNFRLRRRFDGKLVAAAYQAMISREGVVSIQSLENGPPQTIRSGKVTGFDPAKEFTLEFRAIGDQLTAAVDDREVVSVRDTRFAAAGECDLFVPFDSLVSRIEYRVLDAPGSAATGTTVRKMEYTSLDGHPR